MNGERGSREAPSLFFVEIFLLTMRNFGGDDERIICHEKLLSLQFETSIIR